VTDYRSSLRAASSVTPTRSAIRDCGRDRGVTAERHLGLATEVPHPVLPATALGLDERGLRVAHLPRPTTAGSLTSPAGAVAGFSRAFVAAAIVAVLLAVVAFVKMPSTHVTGGGGNLHMH
jgi:hypothetical protein